MQSASRGAHAHRSDAQEVHVQVQCDLHVPACRSAHSSARKIAMQPARRSTMRETLTTSLRADTLSPRLNVGKPNEDSLLHDQRQQRKRKRVGKDLEQWMFLILRTGSSGGFAAGDCEVSIDFPAGYREEQVGP